MAGNVEQILLKIIGDASSGERALRQVRTAAEEMLTGVRAGAAEIDRFSRRAGSAFDRLRQSLETPARGGAILAAAFGGVSAAGGRLIQTTSQIAMRNEVLGLSMHVVGRNAGYTEDELDALVDRVRSLGITTSQATLGVTRLMQGQLDLAQATEVARAAQDLAVIAGENSSETYGNILEAVLSLQPRILRQYGIVTTLQQSLGDLANSTDVAAQRNRFLQYVLEEASRVAGVYEEAMGVVGKRITSIPRLVEEAKAALGKYFVPIIGLGVDALSKLLKAFERLPEGIKKALALFIIIGTAGAAVVAVVAGLLAALPLVLSGISAISGALPYILIALAGIAALLAPLIALGALLVAAWRENWGGIRDAVTAAWARIQEVFAELAPLVRGWIDVIKTHLGEIWAAIKTLLEPAFARLSSLIDSVDWHRMLGPLKDAINVAGRYITAFLKATRGLLAGEGLRSFLPLREAWVDVLTLIALAWDRWISHALSWGYNLVVQAANGIIRAAQTVMVAALRYLGNLIGLFLAPGSPPKRGPLSHIVTWGRGLMETFLQSFALADFGTLQDALAPIRTALESAVGAGRLSDKGFVQVFSRVREQVAGLIADFHKTGQISETALSKIGETLGAGSEELVRYLRLQLEHRRALENLARVQEEVAEAEKQGFIPAELKARLEAAQAEADAAEERVDWQREYLAVMQDSVDIQLRLVQALEKLAAGGGGSGGAGGDGGGAGAGEWEGTGLGLDLGLGDLGGGLGGVTAELGGMTEEFREMRGRVEAFLAAFQAWLALPIEDKLSSIAGWLSEMTGLDIDQFWQDVQAALARVDAEGLFAPVRDILVSGAQNVLAELGRRIRERAGEVWAPIVEEARTQFEEIRRAVADRAAEIRADIKGRIAQIRSDVEGKIAEIRGAITDWLDGILTDMGLKGEKMRARWSAIWEDVRLIAATVWSRITSDVGQRVAALRRAVEITIGQLRTYWRAAWKAVEITFTTIWGHIVAAARSRVQEVYRAVVDQVNEIKTWLGDQVVRFSEIGSRLIDGLTEGILQAAGRLIERVTGVIEDLLSRIKAQLGISSPSRIGLGLGRNFVGSIADGARRLAHRPVQAVQDVARAMAGVDFSPVRAALQFELGRAGLALAGAGMGGGVMVQQTFQGGLVFPNVRDGRDALGVREGLTRRALEASMTARVGGTLRNGG